jgi:hypothetical protein
MGLPPQPPLERALAPSPWKGEGWGGVKGLCSNSNNLCIQGSLGGVPDRAGWVHHLRYKPANPIQPDTFKKIV